MADLSPQALQFLRDHLNYDTRGYLSKKKLRSEMEKFWRRREKALAEFAVLPPDHPRKGEFDTAIKKATETAENGDLKTAYKALDSVKLAARAEANVVKNGLDLNAVLVDLAPLETKVRAVKDAADVYDTFDRQAGYLEILVTMIAPATEATTHDEAIKRAGDALGARTEFRAKVKTLQERSKQLQDDYKTEFDGAPDTKRTMERLKHNADLLRAEGNLPGGVDTRVANVIQDIADLGMSGNAATFVNKLSDRANTCAKAVEAGCALALKLPKMETFKSTDDDGNRLTAEEEADYLGDTFKKLEEQDAKRIEDARERMRAEANWDLYLELNPVEPARVEPSRVEHFDTADVLSVADLGFDPLDRSITPDAFGAAAAVRLDALLAGSIDAYKNANPDDKVKVPDEVLEVASRTNTEWCEEIAKSLGLVWDKENLSPPFLEKIQAGADAMQKKALEIYPDRAAPDMSSFTMGGVLFDDVKRLGEGGGGEVFLAKSADGRQVVIKQALSGKNLEAGDDKDPVIDEMRKEILTHRAITGGEDGACSENLLEHQGMVLSADGLPLAVMDLADAGDASEFNKSMSSLSGTGVLSETARQALVAVQMRDILKGVKAMHDQGYAHFDLKDLNVFMTSDGSFKVADFGLAQEAESRDEVLEGNFESSELFMSPEISNTDDLTMKGDLFSVGAMIQRAQSPLEDQHIDAEGFGSRRAGAIERKENDGSSIEVSASTRLITKLMSEDADERPSIETVLESSYFQEIDHGHSPEQVERLRKAAAQYAATVGRKTKDLENRQQQLRALILFAQRQMSHETTHDLIRAAEVFVARTPGEIEELKAASAAATDPKIKSTFATRAGGRETSLDSMIKKLDEYRKKLDEPISENTIKKARADIERNEAELAKIDKDIKAIREDSQYEDIMKELSEANAAFG